MRGTRISRIFTISAVALTLSAGTVACGSAAASHPLAARPSTSRASTTRPSTTAATSANLLISLAMASPRRGYGLFERQAGARCQALAAPTVDGGAAFIPAMFVTRWNCSGSAPVKSITADGTGDIFVYGPQLFIGRNATGTFARSPQRGTVLAVSAVGRSVWMLVDRCHGSRMKRCSLRLLESVNGGRTWHPASTQPPGGAGGGAPVAESALGQTWLLQTGAASGYVLASPQSARSGMAGSASLFYTRNGGRTWTRSRIPCGQDDMSVVLTRAPGGALAAVCAGEPSAGSQGKMVTLSANGGRSWTKPAGCVLGYPCHGNAVLSDGYLSEIAATSARTVYLIGSRGPLIVTSDGGRRWHQVSPAKGPVIGAEIGGIAQVTFFGRSTGLVVGDSNATGVVQVWRTTDGGRRWSKPVVPGLE